MTGATSKAFVDVPTLPAAHPILIACQSSSSILIEEGSSDSSACALPFKGGLADTDP